MHELLLSGPNIALRCIALLHCATKTEMDYVIASGQCDVLEPIALLCECMYNNVFQCFQCGLHPLQDLMKNPIGQNRWVELQ